MLRDKCEYWFKEFNTCMMFCKCNPLQCPILRKKLNTADKLALIKKINKKYKKSIKKVLTTKY